jgi:D-aspartate ligase
MALSRGPPILLANADFYGTLAATRSLGAHGIPVYIASERLLAPSRWSRHNARALNCPPIDEPNRFLDWLGALGAREPGIVLYATSDETAFLYALRLPELSVNFRTYQPGIEAISNVLDKKRLYAAAAAVGLACPETWYPETDADVERIARDVPMPLLIKARTQVLLRTHSKGVIVTERENLVARYRDFVSRSRYGQVLLDVMPDAKQAMIQRYLPAAARHIFMLTAFVDRDGVGCAVRGATKIFQQPRSLGIGLCFEDAPVDERLAEAARRLAKITGYYGVFSLEFVKDGDRYLLIDHNPRFYNQLAFDLARGLPLPRMVYAAACGDAPELARLVRDAAGRRDSDGLVFCNEFGMRFMLLAQRLAGRVSADETNHWRRWREEHVGRVVDPAMEAKDPLPGVVDVATQLYGYARHPRAFLRKIVLDRTSL